MMRSIQYLKLGGSLITDKARSSTARPEVLARLASEISRAYTHIPDLKLILGHGSGSFGHAAARKYGTRQGVRTEEEWRGFAEVWYEASHLNRLVIEALREVGLAAVSFPASGTVLAKDGEICLWDLAAIEMSLEAGLLPVVYGDVVFDDVLGGTILSTEDIFSYLAKTFYPERILLAGIEAGVWADYPARTKLVREITPHNIADFIGRLSGSAGMDVTGGMVSKVGEMVALVEEISNLEVYIFSGERKGAVFQALRGVPEGTRISRVEKDKET
jgi:isopentenyl phosphate kinase